MDPANVTPRYFILVPDETWARSCSYLESLRTDRVKPGARLRGRIKENDLNSMSERDLLGELFDTKSPQIFAESQVAGDGSDWNLDELGLLGDISVAAPVTVFDNGNHSRPTPHKSPFPATLIFTPGALLRNGRGLVPADWAEATKSDALSPEGYYGLYRRRLLPVLRYINQASARPRSALVTVPGLGCGQFAGPFVGQLGLRLQAALERILAEHGASLPNLKAVYFDPYSECSNQRREINGVSLLTRPLTAPGNERKSQLCRPADYAEAGDDFSDCSLFSVVAWDHVSWPGNDFFIGSRATDDGVKAAATSSMHAITGVQGNYVEALGKYQPPAPYRTWKVVAEMLAAKEKFRLWNPASVWDPQQARHPSQN